MKGKEKEMSSKMVNINTGIEVITPKNVLTPRMLELMADPLTKEMGLIVKLVLKDGSKRKGIYKDLVLDPLKRYEYKDDLFVMLEQTVKEHDTIYTPISQIATIDWAY